ncbi:MAG: hypothetical protein AAF569_00860 [Pseudomonadota bacterium]
MKKPFILSLSLATLALSATACTGPTFRDAQYWQRMDSTSALYLQGPKAQQGLHQDISRCSAELNELKRLGSLKKAIPADPDDKNGMVSWDTPNRDGYRYAEHLDYTDFETCMRTKGWERVEHLPYDIADEARDNWVDTIRGDRKRLEPKETNIEARERDPYDTLNN